MELPRHMGTTDMYPRLENQTLERMPDVWELQTSMGTRESELQIQSRHIRTRLRHGNYRPMSQLDNQNYGHTPELDSETGH